MKRIFTHSFFILLFLILGVGLLAQDIIIEVNSPASVEGRIDLFGVSTGWSAQLQEDTPITADIILADDGSASPTLGCVASPAGAYADRIVFIRRGVCPFSDKVANAEAAGAIAVIIVNNDMTGGVINMSAAEGVSVGIPVFMLNFQTGEDILSALESGPVNMTLNLVRPDDLGIRDYYSPMYGEGHIIPEGLVSPDSMNWSFAASIFNASKVAVPNVEFSVKILFEDEELFSYSELIDMAARTDTLYIAPLPKFEIPATLEVGSYQIVYSVQAEGFVDENPENNTRIIEFFITDDAVYQSSPAHNVITRICFPGPTGAVDCSIQKDYAQGVLFKFPESEDVFALNNVNVVIGGETDASDIDGASLEFLWVRAPANYLDIYSGTAGLEVLSIEGLGEFQASSGDHEQEVNIEVTDTGGERLVIENGATYGGLLFVPAGVMLGWNNEWFNRPIDLGNTLFFWPNLLYFDGVFARSVIRGAMYMKLNMQLVSSVDDIPLPDNSVKLFPNPAQDYTMVELDLPKAMNATITLADISGRVISTNTYQNVQKHSQRLEIGSLSAGTYIVRIATPEGTSTKKLLIVK